METSNKQVSVIVPIYNVEAYLEECLDSICAQTYQEIEIILVNDGSTDNSLAICKHYAEKDSRIQVIDKENGGLSDARNAGLDAATGEYIYFLDSDDFIDPETIALLTAASEAEQVDFINFDGVAFLDGENPWKVDGDISQTYIKKNTYTGIMTGAALFEAQEKCKEYHSPVQMYFFRHSFLLEHALRFYKGILHEDILFMFLAHMAAKRALHLPYAFYHRRMRAGSIMGQAVSEKNLTGLYTVLQQILQYDDFAASDAETRSAYLTGVVSILNFYFSQYYSVQKKSDSVEAQYQELITCFQQNAYFQSKELEQCIEDRKRIQQKQFFQKHRYCRKAGKALKLVYRKLVGKKTDPTAEFAQVFAELQKTASEEKRIIVLCVPHQHGNRGDQAIAIAEKKLLEEQCSDYAIVEIPAGLCEFYTKALKPYLRPNDIYMVHGGGNFGSLWRHNELAALRVLQYVPNSRVIVFPQTIYYSSDTIGDEQLQADRKAFAQLTDLHIFVRDQFSYDFIQKQDLFPNAKHVFLIPDMVISLDMQHLVDGTRNGALLCLRPDLEAVLSQSEKNQIYQIALQHFSHVHFIATNDTSDPISMYDRVGKVGELLKQFAKSELLVTDRLHGMVLAAITGTPCVALNNLSNKVRGVYQWLQDLEYVEFVENVSEVKAAIARVTAVTSPKYDSSVYDAYYQKIIDCIRSETRSGGTS